MLLFTGIIKCAVRSILACHVDDFIWGGTMDFQQDQIDFLCGLLTWERKQDFLLCW